MGKNWGFGSVGKVVVGFFVGGFGGGGESISCWLFGGVW